MRWPTRSAHLKPRRAIDPKVLPKLQGGDHWEDVGTNQFEYLKKEGLQPFHYLLDVACGSFRAGHRLIEYLEPGHYFGIDGSEENLHNGFEYVLRPLGLLDKRPTIVVAELTEEPMDLAALLGRSTFDYIWIHALFDHIPHAVIERCLRDTSVLLGSDARLYATIFLNPHGPAFLEPMVRPRNGSLEGAVVTFPDREYWHHSIEYFEELVTHISGLDLDACLFDYPHPLGLRVLRFVRTQHS